MELTQTWVGRLDRSYEQIKKSLLKRLTIEAPEITDHSETNPLIINLGMFAGVGEVLNLYLDAASRESFWGVARRYTSLARLSKLIDYNIKAKGYASVDELFTLTDEDGNLTTHTADILIPKNTVINPNNGVAQFRLMDDVVIPAGQSSVYGRMGQYKEVVDNILGNTSGAANQRIPISDAYAHNTMRVLIANEDWVQYNSFGLMGPNTKGFVIEIDDQSQAYLVFGDGVNGKIPVGAQTIYGSYLETEGSSGNVPPGSITNFVTQLIMPPGITLNATNPGYASGGADFESMEEIRNRAPRSLRSLDRAVTYQDYIDVALQVVGVGAAEVQYCCGKYVDLYIVPNSRGVATQVLLNKVREHIECRKMITTMVDVKPAGVTRIWVKARIIGKQGIPPGELESATLSALDTNFGQGTAKINRKVSLTDIIATLESQRQIDTAEVSEVRIEPYARPLQNTTNILNIEYLTLPVSTQKFNYKLIYRTATNNFEVYKAGVFLQYVAIGEVFNDNGVISFKVNAGVYQNNDTWEFSVFPSYPEIFPATIINISDYSAAVVDVTPFVDNDTPREIFSEITYETQQATTNCLPPCNP